LLSQACKLKATQGGPWRASKKWSIGNRLLRKADLGLTHQKVDRLPAGRRSIPPHTARRGGVTEEGMRAMTKAAIGDTTTTDTNPTTRSAPTALSGPSADGGWPQSLRATRKRKGPISSAAGAGLAPLLCDDVDDLHQLELIAR